MIRRLAILLAAALGAAAVAQERPGAGSFFVGGVDGGVGESHAWFTVEVESGEVALVHRLPAAILDAGVLRPGAADGTVYGRIRLTERPQALAAVGRRVYASFLPEPGGADGARRSVMSLEVLPSPMRDMWRYGERDRLDVMPSLPGTGTLLGFAGSARGPLALIDESGLRLLLLEGDSWIELDGPGEEASGRAGELGMGVATNALGATRGLVARAEGIGIWGARTIDDVGVWEGRFRESRSVQWNWRPLDLSVEGDDPAADPPNSLYEVRGNYVAAVRAGGGVSIRGPGPHGGLELARVPEAPREFVVYPLDGVTGFGVAWDETDAESDKRAIEVREFSAATGAERYSGRARSAAPVTLGEFRLLAILLIGGMLVVLLAIVRSNGDERVSVLPAGTSLAEPSRRLVAAGLDALPAAILATRLLGVPFSELVSLEGLAEDGWVALLLTLVIGFAHTTLCEWRFGVTIGKLLTGCAVVSVVPDDNPGGEVKPPEDTRPRLVQAVLRNLVKWSVTPVAFVGLFAGDGRHRGDLLGRTAVVVGEEQPRER